MKRSRCATATVAILLTVLSVSRVLALPIPDCAVNISSADISADPTLSSQEMYALLAVHNNARNSIRYATSMPLMEWSSAVASEVATWVKKCDQSTPWSDPNAGFNLGFGDDSQAWAVANGWVSQISNYTYTDSTCTTSSEAPAVCGACTTGNFKYCNSYLQIIWASSTSIGCAKAQCSGSTPGSTTTWVICGYSPRGLIANQAPYVSSSAALVGCQYASAAPAAPGTSTWKVLGGIGAGILMLLGGGAYMYMDGGDACCCDGKTKSERRTYDADAMDQLNTTQIPILSPPVVDAIPIMSSNTNV
jgi:pathogenesis-related protein 1